MSAPVQNADATKPRGGAWKRAGVAMLGLSTLLVGGIGFLHTSVGRPLLMKVGGCPIAEVDPHAVQQGAQRSVATERGAEAAPARPALGFVLDHTRLADLQTWADMHELSCESVREGTLYKCKAVPATALPDAAGMTGRIDDLTFGFKSDGTLWAVSAWSFRMPAVDATARLRSVSAALEHAVGKPASESGSVDTVGAAPGTGSGAKYKYRDYVANLSALTSPDGVMVQQQYSSTL